MMTIFFIWQRRLPLFDAAHRHLNVSTVTAVGEIAVILGNREVCHGQDFHRGSVGSCSRS